MEYVSDFLLQSQLIITNEGPERHTRDLVSTIACHCGVLATVPAVNRAMEAAMVCRRSGASVRPYVSAGTDEWGAVQLVKNRTSSCADDDAMTRSNGMPPLLQVTSARLDPTTHPTSIMNPILAISPFELRPEAPWL
eukprot:scaffold50028_cov50-Attheya_sp.AAC.2